MHVVQTLSLDFSIIWCAGNHSISLNISNVVDVLAFFDEGIELGNDCGEGSVLLIDSASSVPYVLFFVFRIASFEVLQKHLEKVVVLLELDDSVESEPISLNVSFSDIFR